MADKRRPPQTGNIRIDELTSAALDEVAKRTLLSKKSIATLALRAWLEENHPDVYRKLIAQAKKKS